MISSILHLKGGFAGPFFWLAGLPGDTLKSKWQTGIFKNCFVVSS